MNHQTFIVYDLEYTAWEGSRIHGWTRDGEHREIIQIGAVRLGSDFKEQAFIDIVVKPRLNPQLSDYIVRLTGISQARIDAEGVDIAEAMARFAAFAGPDAPLISNGKDAEVIAENCTLFKLPDPFAGRYHDIRPLLAVAAGGHEPHSCDLPKLLGIPAHGHAHDGVADARAVAGALAWLKRHGWLKETFCATAEE
jgi:inhibitor of KinA sporulation pathway (predicted exonuclease)